MKKIGVALVLTALLYGDEIERINALVKEIESMRVGYEKCEEHLKLCRSASTISAKSTQEQECKNSLENHHDSKRNEIQKLHSQIQSLKNQIDSYQNDLKAKSRKIAFLQQKIEMLETKRKENQNNADTANGSNTCRKELVTVKKKNEESVHTRSTKKVSAEITSYRITKTQPKTFRTLREADIYDKPDGVKIARWEKGRSFTSYIESGEWVKITGYFINRKWTSAKKGLWIKKSDAFERKQ